MFIGVAATTCAAIAKRIPLYVAAGVPSWIVNIALRQVEFYGSPADLASTRGIVYAVGDEFTICGVSIQVADLFEPLDADTIS